MTTEHALPWIDDHRWSTFRETLGELRELELTGESGITRDNIDALAWRHWIVAFAVEHALTSVRRAHDVSLVECGVADGVTAFVTLRELERHRGAGAPPHTVHLYDSWSSMRRDLLLPGESVQGGRYSRLSLDVTKRNLASFSGSTEYHVGYIPESLSSEPQPSGELVYVQVDLNAASPTAAVCEHFWPRLAPGGVMLFDDYGWLGFEDTKRVVDSFFAGRPGSLLKLATGQAMFLRSSTA